MKQAGSKAVMLLCMKAIFIGTRSLSMPQNKNKIRTILMLRFTKDYKSIEKGECHVPAAQQFGQNCLFLFSVFPLELWLTKR